MTGADRVPPTVFLLQSTTRARSGALPEQNVTAIVGQSNFDSSLQILAHCAELCSPSESDESRATSPDERPTLSSCRAYNFKKRLLLHHARYSSVHLDAELEELPAGDDGVAPLNLCTKDFSKPDYVRDMGRTAQCDCETEVAAGQDIKQHEHWKSRQPVPCVICGNMCSNPFNMKQHIENVHTSGKGVKCSECGRWIKNSCYLRRHMVNRHNAPLKRKGHRRQGQIMAASRSSIT